MSPQTETALINACHTLFGKDLFISKDFLWYLQPAGLKAAYRQKAKEAHPDRFNDLPAIDRQEKTAFFQEVNQAYDLLRSFFSDREKRTEKPIPHSAARRQPSQTASEPETKHNAFRRVPERTLEFGQYLYNRGLITYPQLIEALVWQRQQRPSIGQLAVNFGWLKSEDTLRVVRTSGTAYSRFGERAIHLGLLSSGQVQVLLRHQRNLHQKLGEYFIELGILSRKEVEHLALKLVEHNQRIFLRSSKGHKRQTP
jgi:hypothetical protein